MDTIEIDPTELYDHIGEKIVIRDNTTRRIFSAGILGAYKHYYHYDYECDVTEIEYKHSRFDLMVLEDRHTIERA